MLQGRTMLKVKKRVPGDRLKCSKILCINPTGCLSVGRRSVRWVPSSPSYSPNLPDLQTCRSNSTKCETLADVSLKAGNLQEKYHKPSFQNQRKLSEHLVSKKLQSFNEQKKGTFYTSQTVITYIL